MVTYRVIIQPAALKMLKTISDRRVQKAITDRIEGLATEPEKQGKPLTDELAGYRSLRAVGQRYRIIYRVEKGRVLVLVVAVGMRKEGSRKDVYALAQRLIRLRLLDPPRE